MTTISTPQERKPSWQAVAKEHGLKIEKVSVVNTIDTAQIKIGECGRESAKKFLDGLSATSYAVENLDCVSDILYLMEVEYRIRFPKAPSEDVRDFAHTLLVALQKRTPS